jgi:hypothetical protein
MRGRRSMSIGAIALSAMLLIMIMWLLNRRCPTVQIDLETQIVGLRDDSETASRRLYAVHGHEIVVESCDFPSFNNRRLYAGTIQEQVAQKITSAIGSLPQIRAVIPGGDRHVGFVIDGGSESVVVFADQQPVRDFFAMIRAVDIHPIDANRLPDWFTNNDRIRTIFGDLPSK